MRRREENGECRYGGDLISIEEGVLKGDVGGKTPHKKTVMRS